MRIGELAASFGRQLEVERNPPMGIEQDIKDLRDDFRTLKAMGHELVMSTTLSQLLQLARKHGSEIDMSAIVTEVTENVESGARAVERSDPMGAAQIRSVGDQALRLLRPAARGDGRLVPALSH
jgi:streptomycin 6-kinase